MGGLGLTGCSSIGPRTVPADRADYADAIGDAWMRQTLLNIVKLRYHEPPIFVDVGSIIAGYSVERTAGGYVNLPSSGSSLLNLNGNVRFTDRPTITYTPMTGGAFMRGLLQPISPAELLFTIQSGWDASPIFTSAVASINGLHNRRSSTEGAIEADPEFVEMVQLFSELALSGELGMRVIQESSTQQVTLLTFYDQRASAEMRRKGSRLRELLGLKPEINSFKVVFGAVAHTDDEIAIRTHSLIQIISIVAAEMEVPAEHIAEGITIPGPQYGGHRLAPIRCSAEKPEHAMVRVNHRDYWYWVDDQDVHAKRSFTFLMVLFILADNGPSKALPLVTIPAQ